MFSIFRSRASYDDVGTEPPAAYPLCPQPIRDADFIPLRLTMGERKVQRLMRGVMLASRYTDKVDTMEAISSKKRDLLVAKEIVNAFSGLIAGLSLAQGVELMRSKDFTPYKADIAAAIEANRRYKIMNPDVLRTDYVKFLYMIQDASQSESVQEMLGFNVVRPLTTIGKQLKALRADSILTDSDLPIGITPVPVMKDRNLLNKALRYKDVMVDKMVKRHAKDAGAKVEDVEMCVRSLNDANNFANDNVVSTVRLIELLRECFPPTDPQPDTDLSITEGASGSRLTHDHSKQFYFVIQSLSLWKNICRRMYSLWIIAEDDLLCSTRKYELRNTGQGLQRVQPAPNLYKAIHDILEETKQELGKWVGSERIHLGDDQVPNAFHFIDKYGQISRIIIPVLRTIDNIDKLAEDEHHKAYMKKVWGSATGAKKAILRDFFRHGFDGSGGDNMDDAGSCIDGRLTSAWNWCNTIRVKPFYPLFLLAGFSSFDGDLSI
jgi:hypothetical protein